VALCTLVVFVVAGFWFLAFVSFLIYGG
jgi:hypothetical protein